MLRIVIKILKKTNPDPINHLINVNLFSDASNLAFSISFKTLSSSSPLQSLILLRDSSGQGPSE